MKISKITEIACFWARSSKCVSRHLNWKYSFWMFWIGCMPPWSNRQSSLGEQFLRFLKIYLSWYNRIIYFSPFWNKKILCFQVFLLRSIKAYLCQLKKLIHFDIVGFVEHCPKEVTSFFSRSVYMDVQSTLPKSNSHKSNNYLSRRSIQVLFSLYSIVFNPS